MTIYDYDNRPVEVELPDKEIQVILVQVSAGDETGYVLFEDGSRIQFDASTTRIIDYDDGAYEVRKEHAAEWLNWKPINNGSFLQTYSYARMNWYRRNFILRSCPTCESLNTVI